MRLPGDKSVEESRTPAELRPMSATRSLFDSRRRGKLKPVGLSSLENNVVVIEILDAARESIRTGKTVPPLK